MSKLILLVDDEPASQALLARALQRAGHLVITASSGVDARLALEAARFDVVVTDIFMPDMDGLELIRHICATSVTTPIIAISGGPAAPAHDFLPIAAALGANMVLPKPVSPAALRYAVDKVVVDFDRSTRCTMAAHAVEASVMLGDQEAGAPL
jgi:two-component system chemotaxis response regulator CheY